MIKPSPVLLFYWLLLPFLQSCVDVTSFFDDGPSDEELFKQSSDIKVFPPTLTNVKDGDVLNTLHPWEGKCSTDATIEIKSPNIKDGQYTLTCKDKKFSQVIPWNTVPSKDVKVEVNISQTKLTKKSEELKILISLSEEKAEEKTEEKSEVKTSEKKEVAPIEVTPIEAAPTAPSVVKNDVINDVNIAPKTNVEQKEQKEPIVVVQATPTSTPEKIEIKEEPKLVAVATLAAPEKAEEQKTLVTSIQPETASNTFVDNKSSEVLIDLTGAIVINEVGAGGGKGFSGARYLIDEQRVAGDPKLNKGNNGFKTSWSEAARLNSELSYQKSFLAGLFDLGKLYELTEVYIFGGNNVVSFYSGGPVKDWMIVGQARLKPGIWNKITFDKKLNTKFLKVVIDFLSNDLDGQVIASSGSEMVLYGKPFDNRTPAGIPESKEILKAKSFDDFVGVNLFITDPVGNEWIYSPDAKGKFKQKNAIEPLGIEAFSHVRVKLYTPWFLTHFDHEAPNWLLRFQSISLENQRLDLDYFFQELNKQKSLVNNKNISVYPIFEYTIPSLFPQKVKDQVTKDNLRKKDLEGQTNYPWEMGKVKPLSTSDKTIGKLPKDFKDEAELYFQYAGRYGSTPSTLLEQYRKISSDQKPQNGLNSISAIEVYTHPDKAKNTVCPECSFFHPFEYAAYLSAIYDGDQKALGPNFGIKSSAPAMPVIFGSLSIPSIDYPLMVSMWSKEYRSSQSLPFDILGYTANSRSEGKAAMPEKSGLYDTFKKLVVEKNRYFPDKEIWITEFGFESNPASTMGVEVPPGSTPEEVQGLWLTRGLLLLSAAGVDRVYLHPLFDNTQFSQSTYGLIYSGKDQYKSKKSYFMIGSLIKSLHEYVFEKFVDPIEEHKGNQDVITLKFRHQTNEKKSMYVSWTPTNNGSNHVLSQYQVPLDLNIDIKTTKAQVLNLSSDNVVSVRSPASINQGGNIMIDVKEAPTLVEVEAP